MAKLKIRVKKSGKKKKNGVLARTPETPTKIINVDATSQASSSTMSGVSANASLTEEAPKQEKTTDDNIAVSEKEAVKTEVAEKTVKEVAETVEEKTPQETEETSQAADVEMLADNKASKNLKIEILD